MAKKRPEFSFPELEHRGRNAILRSSEEVQAEQALLEQATPSETPLPAAPLPAVAGVARDPAVQATGSNSRPGGESPSPQQSPAPDQERAPASTSSAAPARVRARTRLSGDASAGFSPPPPTPPAPSAAVLERLRQKLRVKQHLSSYTFRFRPEELVELDNLVAELNQARTSKLSKNDLVRLALGWLLTDYEEYGQASLVVEVTRQE